MVEVHDQFGKLYNTKKQIRFKKTVLRSELCDYNDADIVVKGTITVTDPTDANYKKELAFKNNASFISYIS